MRVLRIGPVIVTADELPIRITLTMTCTITRNGKHDLLGRDVDVAAESQDRDVLIEYLLRSNPVPAGSVLLTGTGIIVKEDAALAPGDTIVISADEIGELSNGAVAV